MRYVPYSYSSMYFKELSLTKYFDRDSAYDQNVPSTPIIGLSGHLQVNIAVLRSRIILIRPPLT
jgi:hypothetical protein